MSKTKHTPGPWVLLDRYTRKMSVDGRADFAALRLGTANRERVVGEVYLRPDCEREAECRANAEHIVKCVNLHDELVACLKRLERAHGAPSVFMNEAMDEVRLLLAKAEAV